MNECSDNVEVASKLVLEPPTTRSRRNVDTKALVVEHNNRLGIQVINGDGNRVRWRDGGIGSSNAERELGQVTGELGQVT